MYVPNFFIGKFCWANLFNGRECKGYAQSPLKKCIPVTTAIAKVKYFAY